MKTKLIALLSLLGLPLALNAGTPVATHVPVEHIYSPMGFHDHESSEVIVSGFLPNLCHKSPQTQVMVEDGVIRIQLKANYYQASDYFCPPVLVPFVESINVGVLDKGDYQVLANPNTPFEKRSGLNVIEYASSAMEDLVFANVSHVELTGVGREAVIKGYNPSDCFELDRIEVSDNKADTYSVYPILKQVSEFCPKKMVPFTYSFQVPETLSRDRVLLHVKGMDGRSVNHVIRNWATH